MLDVVLATRTNSVARRCRDDFGGTSARSGQQGAFFFVPRAFRDGRIHPQRGEPAAPGKTMLRLITLGTFLTLTLWGLLLNVQSITQTPGSFNRTGRLGIYAANPRYLQDAAGHPLVLIGFGNERKNSSMVLDRLQGKINYQRAYAALWSRHEDPNAYYGGKPWVTVHGKMDMDTWNETYWANLRDYIENARDRGITVGLTIWDGHSDLPGGKFGSNSVWNARYNWQGVQWAYDARALGRYAKPGPTGALSERLVFYQRRWIDRLINEITEYPNVLIELDNETKLATEIWWLWWADYFIKKGNFVIATTWTDRYTISDSTFSQSPLLHMKSYHSRSTSVLTSRRLSWKKVIIVDADDSCSNLDAEIARRSAWKAILKGGHWNDFVCSGATFPDPTKIQYYGYLLKFFQTRSTLLTEMSPHQSLSSNTIASKNGIYYLAFIEEDREKIDLDLRGTKDFFNFEWYDTKSGEIIATGQVQGGAVKNFSPPFKRDLVLWVQRNTAN